jgi:hypothetical protein
LRAEWERYSQPPADGLRPYHPADLDAAIALIQCLRDLPDAEAARAVLRRWWRQIDRQVCSFQVEGQVVGLLALQVEDLPLVLDIVVEKDHIPALGKILSGPPTFPLT